MNPETGVTTLSGYFNQVVFAVCMHERIFIYTCIILCTSFLHSSMTLTCTFHIHQPVLHNYTKVVHSSLCGQ